MFVFKIAQFFNPLNEIEAIDNAWVDDKNWFPKVNQKYLWILYPLVRWKLGLEMEDGSDGLRGSRMADRLEMSTRPLVKIA